MSGVWAEHVSGVLELLGPSEWGDGGLNQTDAGTGKAQAGDKSHLTHKKGVGGDFPVLLLQRGGKKPKATI